MAPGRERIAHYRIVRPLGAGAMGEVYEAEDERLQRRVAVKVIAAEGEQREQMRRRFLREAQASSALTHSNVAHIYDVGSDDGTDYIAMELIEGETLAVRLARGGLPIDEIVGVALQLADGLAAAHERGIVHRDVKPSNFMVTRRGQVKVLDFGLARIDAAARETDATIDHATSPGTILGTTSYMSPEQALGEPVTPASDVFSAGVVLYEMIAGRLPFAGKTAADTLHRITTAEPEPLARFNYELPVELERIVRRCLEKVPSHRYRSAAELLTDLQALTRDRSSGERTAPRWAAARPSYGRRAAAVAIAAVVAAAVVAAAVFRHREAPVAAPLATPPARVIQSVAVLPFRISGDPADAYMADGMTESLIDTLGESPHLLVIARSTVFEFRESTETPQKIGRRLGVDGVVTGDIRQHPDGFTLSAEIVRVNDGARIWGDRYERHASAMVIVDELSRDVGHALGVDRPPRGAAEAGRARETAEMYYLRAQSELNARNQGSIEAAVADCHRAIAADSSYPQPYATLAQALTLSARYGGVPTSELQSAARRAAGRALKLAPSLADAHVAMASVYDMYDWDLAAAEKEYRAALALRPNDALAHRWYALLLARMGRTAEADREKQLACAVDPLSAQLKLFAANIDYYGGRLDSAESFCSQVMKLQLAPLQMALIDLQRGRYDAVGAQLAAYRPPNEAAFNEVEAIGAVMAARQHHEAAAVAALAKLQASGADYEAAVVAAAIHRPDVAIPALERACASRTLYAGYAAVDPLLEPLRSDPAFADVLRRAGLTGFSPSRGNASAQPTVMPPVARMVVNSSAGTGGVMRKPCI